MCCKSCKDYSLHNFSSQYKLNSIFFAKCVILYSSINLEEYMKRNIIFLLSSLFITSSFLFAWAEENTHPVEMEGRDCLTCHAEGSTEDMASDPTAYIQWSNSLHGLINVKCVVCHGEESTFKPKSNINICLSCHPSETTNISAKIQDNQTGLICTSCHQAHTFTPVKSNKKVHSK